MSAVLAAALYRPGKEIFSQIKDPAFGPALNRAASILQGNAEGDPTAPREEWDLPGRVAEWVGTFDGLTLERLVSLYGTLFGHTPRGTVCPYETEYGNEGLFQQPQQLATMAGLYRSFGLQVGSSERERPDHVSCELEFLDFLGRKEAYALEQGEAVMLEETRRATRIFLKEHLGRFARAFARLLGKEDPHGFFGKLGDLLFDFVTFQCQRFGVEAGPAVLLLRPPREETVPMACAGAGDLVQLET